MAQVRTDWSLGALIEASFGPFPPNFVRRNSPYGEDYTRGLWNWYRINAALRGSGKPLHCLLPGVTVWHQRSFELLHDWWTAEYQPAAHSLAAVLSITSKSEDLGMFWQEKYNYIDDGLSRAAIMTIEDAIRSLQLKGWPTGDVVGASNKVDFCSRENPLSYHARMLLLFNVEFSERNHNPVQETRADLAARRQVRREAALYAYCQELAWRVFYCRSAQLLGQASHPKPADKAAGRTGQKALPEHVSHSGNLARGPIIDACPWLGRSVTLHDMDMDTQRASLPHFLWDVKNARTVESARLGTRPRYTIISHTWGRWRLGQPVSLAGVPWKVPQTTRFDVRQIPSLLAKLPGRPAFVWFDLVCIPQDDSLLGKREIARQGEIFLNAEHVFAWLNDVDSLQTLEAVLECQALQLLHLPESGDPAIRDCFVEEALAETAGKQTGLLVPRPQSPLPARIEPNAWFTSLWTLQEMALRPDVQICSKDWSVLQCCQFAGTRAFPVPLSGFLAIQEILRIRMANPEESQDQSHLALTEALAWNFETSLCCLLASSRTTLLALGDRRECTGRRAEAIMSALGLIRWYTDALDGIAKDRSEEPLRTPPNAEDLDLVLERDLVLGKYPLAFVEELAVCEPGDFFARFMRLNLDTGLGTVFYRMAGSMLPFSSGEEYYADANISWETGMLSCTHMSFLNWKVLATGEVGINEACIVSQSPSSVETSSGVSTDALGVLPGSVIGEVSECPPGARLTLEYRERHPLAYGGWKEDNIDLRAWCKSQSQETYLVLVRYAEMFRQLGHEELVLLGIGIILQKLPSGAMFKLGHFIMLDLDGTVDVSHTTAVEWKVG